MKILGVQVMAHRSGARNVAPMSEIVESSLAWCRCWSGASVPGAGVPYAALRPQITDRMDDTWRRIYDVAGFLAAVPGLTERLVFEVMLQGCARSNTT